VLGRKKLRVGPAGGAEIHQTMRRVDERGRTNAADRDTAGRPLRSRTAIAVLAKDGMVAEGSHEELLSGVPLYRLLMAAGRRRGGPSTPVLSLAFLTRSGRAAEPGPATPARAAAAVMVTAQGNGGRAPPPGSPGSHGDPRPRRSRKVTHGKAPR